MATAGISRRALFARLRGGAPQLRPPWSRSDEVFTDRCTLCGDCIAACETGVISTGHAGYPIIDFARGHCTFCGNCRNACQNDAFEHEQAAAPWHLAAAIDKSCVELSGVTCRVCQDVCEHDAIGFSPSLGGRSKPAVVSDRCTGCGACVGACPVHAVAIGTPRTTTQELQG